jgi:two-component system, NarL family, nitrate/nitrite response regulator NarL
MKAGIANFASIQSSGEQGNTLATIEPCRAARTFAAREAPAVRLTPRELEVLALLCEGLPNKLISRRLDISSATVKCHISRILSELGVSSRLQAVVAAARSGLVRDASMTGTASPLPQVRHVSGGLHGSLRSEVAGARL